MTELEEKPADTGSGHDDDLIHVVCCTTRLCDGKPEEITVPPGVYPDDCIVCVDLEFVAGVCRECGAP